MTHQPFKCPDCGLWWRTETHRCSDYPPNKGLSPVHPPKPKYPSTKIDVDNLDLCVVCERVYDTRSPHHCNKSIQYEKNKKPQFDSKDDRYNHPTYDKWRN
jgi:hypothetical protein